MNSMILQDEEAVQKLGCAPQKQRSSLNPRLSPDYIRDTCRQAQLEQFSLPSSTTISGPRRRSSGLSPDAIFTPFWQRSPSNDWLRQPDRDTSGNSEREY